MDAVLRQAQSLKKACSKSNAEWSELSVAITELADAVDALDIDDHSLAISEHLLPLSLELAELLRNIRSKLVFDVCEQIGRMVKTMQLAFTPLANMLLDALASTAKASSVAIRNPGFQLFSDVSQYARYDLQAVLRVYRSSPQERVKTLLLEQLQIALTYWSKNDIEPFYPDVLEIMRRGMRDPSSHVRTACRETFCSFADVWQERLADLVDIPTQPARDLLIKEKPYAAITKAIRLKFNIKTPIKDTRADAIRQRRAAVRRQGVSAGEDDDSVFVEVKESPRRPLQRKVLAEQPKRVPSPARGPPRSASPSSTKRTTAATGARTSSPSSVGRTASPNRATTRGASPSAAGRTASPARAATRGASPSRTTKDGMSGPAGRAASPGRLQRAVPTHTKDHASVTSPGVRDREFDRYINATILEEKAAATTVLDEHHRPNQAALPRKQKRVSIAEPSTMFDPSHQSNGYDYPHGPAMKPHDLNYRDPNHGDELTLQETHRDLSQPSSNASSPPKSRFAAAARDFISRPQATSFGYNDDFEKFANVDVDVDDVQARDISSYTADYSGPDQEETLESPPVRGEVYSQHLVRDESEVDSFFDRSIPGSSPAPTPRAPANITERDRRRYVDNFHRKETLGEYARQPHHAPTYHVPDEPVAESLSQVESSHSKPRQELSRSTVEETPPSVSIIDSLFRTNNMDATRDDMDITLQPTAPAASTEMDMAPGDFPGEEEDKENIGDENYCPQNAQVGVPKPDALANLDAIRAGLKVLQSQLGGVVGKVSVPSKVVGTEPKALAVPQYDDHAAPTSQEQQSLKDVANSQPDVTAKERHRGDMTTDRQPRPTLAIKTAPCATNVPTAKAQVDARLAPSKPPMARLDTATLPKPVVATQVAQKLSPDFVRQPAAFTFASAAQPQRERVQQTQMLPAPAHHLEVVQPQRHSQQPSAPQRAFHDERPPTVVYQPGNSPTKPTMPAPVRMAAAPPANIQHLPRHTTGQEALDRRESQNAPCQRTPYSLKEGLPAHAGIHATRPVAHNSPPAPEQPLQPSPPIQAPHRRNPVLNPQPDTIQRSVATKMIYSFCLVLGAIFGISGLIQATTKVRDAYAYHNALLTRINQFELSIVDSYESVRKMDEKYTLWSEYVRELTEQDETHALDQLEGIQVEVAKWQTEMKNDLVAFKQSLSGDIIDAALAHLREPNTSTTDAAKTTTTTEAAT